MPTSVNQSDVESKARNEMLRELCAALGWGEFASPQTPQEVWYAALRAVAQMRDDGNDLRAALESITREASMVVRRHSPATWERRP